MKQVIWKFFNNHEKEEAWLNEMSSTGYHLIQYTWCRYVFEVDKSKRYIYRLEFLEHIASSPENNEYMEFLREANIEHISSYIRWIYLRRDANEGVFEIYTDAESKILHYKRINKFWGFMMYFELAILIFILSLTAKFYTTRGYFPRAQISNILIISFCTWIFYYLRSGIKKKIKKLKEDI